MRPNLTFGPIDSVGQYLLYLSVIAIGIFVPLLIQRLLRRKKEKDLVKFTTEAMREELRFNTEAMGTARDSFAAVLQRHKDEIAFFRQAWETLQAGSTNTESPPANVTPVVCPVARTTSWEMAKLGGALPLLGPAQLLTFSDAYRLLEVFNRSREEFVRVNFASNAIDAPYDVNDSGAISRRLERLLVQESAVNYMRNLSVSTLKALSAAIDA